MTTLILSKLWRRGVIFLTAAFITLPSYALNVQTFAPDVTGQGTVRHQSTRVLAPWELRAGVFLNFAKEQLVLRRGTGPALLAIVDQSINTNLVAHMGILPQLDLNINLPVSLIRHLDNNGTTTSNSHFRLGDVRITGKYQILDSRSAPFGLAILPNISIPTGQSNHYLGDRGFNYGLRLNADYYLDRFYLVGSVGFNGRSSSQSVDLGTALVDPFTVKDELLFGLGLGFDLIPHKMRLLIDLAGSTPLAQFAERENTSPIEATGAIEYRFKTFALTLGGGGGLALGYGAPDYRVFSGISYVGKAPAQKPEPPTVAFQPIILQGATFASGSAELSNDAKKALQRTLQSITQHIDAPHLIQITGHTDDRGDSTSNLALSQARADAVRDYFVAHGIPAHRIKSLGKGETEALAPNNSENNRALNRRVVIDLITRERPK